MIPALSPPETDEQRQQVEELKNLLRLCTFAADQAAKDSRLNVLTGSDRTRSILQSALGQLLSQGLIRFVADYERDHWIAMDCPDHLRPDIGAMLVRRAWPGAFTGE